MQKKSQKSQINFYDWHNNNHNKNAKKIIFFLLDLHGTTSTTPILDHLILDFCKQGENLGSWDT